MFSDADRSHGEPCGMQSAVLSRKMRFVAYGLGTLAFLSVLGTASLLAQSVTPGQPSRGNLGCTAKRSQTGVSTQTTVDGNRIARTYLLQVPQTYDPKQTYPVIFVFHGRGGNSTQSHSWGLQNVPGASESGIFVFPQGIDFHHEGIGWDDTNGSYDMSFFDTMLSEIESVYCIDDTRVFVAGFSWGADFATSLACSRGDRIRAIAVNSTNDEFADKANFKTYRYLPCPALRYPAVRFEHAVEGDSAYPAPYFATTGKLFQYMNRCGKDSKPAPSSATAVSCISYAGCAQQVLECSFDKGIGHKLPPNWSQDTWDFFQSFHHL